MFGSDEDWTKTLTINLKWTGQTQRDNFVSSCRMLRMGHCSEMEGFAKCYKRERMHGVTGRREGRQTHIVQVQGKGN